MKATKEELARLMGKNDSDYESAGQLQTLLHLLYRQRQLDIDSDDGGYPYAAMGMYTETFGKTAGSTYDSKFKSLWYLEKKVSQMLSSITLLYHSLTT